MDFKQLQSYVTVVKYKSFTIAAEMLGTSQPTISTHIRILEEELNSWIERVDERPIITQNDEDARKRLNRNCREF